MLRRLSAKLTLALLAILAVTCGAWIVLTLFATRLYQEEVDQGLHSGTAGPAKARGRRSRAASASEPTFDLDDILPTTIEGGD